MTPRASSPRRPAVAVAVAATAMAIGCPAACQPPPDAWIDAVCDDGAGCACEVDTDCVLTGYHSPVSGPADCYCDDTSCGTSVPLRADAADANRAEWEVYCPAIVGPCLPHCALHPPERALCVDGACAKLIQP